MRFPEWNCDRGSYSRESTVEVQNYQDRDSAGLAKFEDRYGVMSRILSHSLGQFKAREKRIERHTKKRGRINSKYVGQELIRLHAGRDLTQKVYDRKMNPKREQEKLNMSMGILLDQSGSTRFEVSRGLRRIDLIKYSALTIGRSLSSSGDGFFIYSFHTHSSTNPTIMEKLKGREERWSSTIEERIAAIEETSHTNYYNNKDGVAIRFANAELLKMENQSRYLFLVTDGNPNCDYEYYQDSIAYQDTRKAMEEGKEKGIRYVYLTINPERAERFMSTIDDVVVFSKRYTRMNDVVEGLTLVYESIKKGRY